MCANNEEKRKSFFSKDSISTIITETIEYINVANNQTVDYIQIDKEQLAKHLLKDKKINETIYDVLVDYKVETCHAIVQKKGKNRCSNPAKKGQHFCNYHINNPPDITIEDHKRTSKT